MHSISKFLLTGINSFKAYFGYPGLVMLNNTEMYKVMKMARNLGALVMVHAETGEMVKEVSLNCFYFIKNKFADHLTDRSLVVYKEMLLTVFHDNRNSKLNKGSLDLLY